MSECEQEKRRAYREQRMRLICDEDWQGDRLGLLLDLIYLEVMGSPDWGDGDPADRDKLNLVVDRLCERWGYSCDCCDWFDDDGPPPF
jgi:hypothetical protein